MLFAMVIIGTAISDAAGRFTFAKYNKNIKAAIIPSCKVLKSREFTQFKSTENYLGTLIIICNGITAKLMIKFINSFGVILLRACTHSMSAVPWRPIRHYRP